MMPSIDNIKKRSRGRPPVDTEAVTVRLPRELIEAIDQWRDNALGQPSRPEAIRRLVDKGLKAGE